MTCRLNIKYRCAFLSLNNGSEGSGFKFKLNYNNCSIFTSPGALSHKYNPYNSNPISLCALCSNQKTCPRNVSERYYGYQGAYRCLTEGSGDVAFVSHLTVFDFTGIDNDLNPGRDFKLLCTDGTRAGKARIKAAMYTNRFQCINFVSISRPHSRRIEESREPELVLFTFFPLRVLKESPSLLLHLFIYSGLKFELDPSNNLNQNLFLLDLLYSVKHCSFTLDNLNQN